MKRLTTDDKNSLFSFLNMFYAKDEEVWVRGGGHYPDYKDVSLVQWIKSASAKHGLSFTSDDPENLAEEMYDALQDGDETVEGIISLLHAAAVQAAEMRSRTKMIEDILGDDYDLARLKELIEADLDSRCVVLPCKLHDKVFFIENGCVKETEVDSFHNWTSGRWKISTHTDRMYDHWKGYEIDFSGIGKTVFLTREAAEAAMKGEKDE